MKSKILYFIFTLFIISCYDDKGNYNYTEINEVSISGIKTFYDVSMGISTLAINPVIEMTLADPDDKERFEYLWVLKGDGIGIDTISYEKNLSYPIHLNPNPYELYLKINDKNTDVQWKANTEINVGTEYTRGILLIGENTEGNAEVHIIAMNSNDTIAYTNNIFAESDLPSLQKPRDIIHTGGNNARTKLWMLTGTGSFHVDLLSHKSSLARSFNNMVLVDVDENLNPIDIVPRVKDNGGNTANNSNRAFLCDNGYIFYNWVGLMGDVYGYPVNCHKDNQDVLLKPKPFLFYSLLGLEGLVWYDSENERFMCCDSPLNYYSQPLEDDPDSDNFYFPWDQKGTGRTLIYGENTLNSDGGTNSNQCNTFTIMSDGNNHYIYKFYASKLGDKRACYDIGAEALGIMEADFYAFSSKRTALFYVYNNTLYAYDYNPGNSKFYTFDLGGDEITMLRFDYQIEPDVNALYIATYNSSTGGTLQKFVVGNDPDRIELIPDEICKWSGFSKIKNMSWRATQ